MANYSFEIGPSVDANRTGGGSAISWSALGGPTVGTIDNTAVSPILPTGTRMDSIWYGTTTGTFSVPAGNYNIYVWAYGGSATARTLDCSIDGVSKFTAWNPYADAGNTSNAVAKKISNVTLTGGSVAVAISGTDGAYGFLVFESVAGGGGDTTAPTVPGTPTFASVTSTSYTVNWTASTDDVGVTGYDLIKSTTSDFSSGNTTYNLGNVTTYSATGLSPSTTYYWKVRAHDAVPNNSAYSASASQATSAASSDTTPPSDVGTITPSVISSSQINLDWSDATDNVAVTDYLIEYATDSGFTSSVQTVTVGSNTSAKNITGLSASTLYYFRVKAKDAAGNYSADWSATASATTSAPPVETPPVNSIAGYELLQTMGSFGIAESVGRARSRASYGDGFKDSALFGEKTGLKKWRLKWDTLVQTLDRKAYVGTDYFNEADYLRDFYNRFDVSGAPFVIKSPVNQQYYLAEFSDEEMTLEKFQVRLFTTGLALEQRRLRGVSVFQMSQVAGAVRSFDASALSLADSANVTAFNDSINSANLAGTATYPIYKTNITNGKGIIRFSGTSNPLTNSDTFSFRHLFVVAKYSGSAFANAAGLVTDSAGWGGLIGVNGGTVFQSLNTLKSDVTWKAKVNGADVSPAAIPAPMNAFKLIEIRSDALVSMVGLSLGKDRASGAKWNGDIAEIFATNAPLLDTDIFEIEENLMRRWAIS